MDDTEVVPPGKPDWRIEPRKLSGMARIIGRKAGGGRAKSKKGAVPQAQAMSHLDELEALKPAEELVAEGQKAKGIVIRGGGLSEERFSYPIRVIRVIRG